MFSNNNYNFNTDLVFYPFNKLELKSVSTKNSRTILKKVDCKHCNTETCYDCSQCDQGITEIYETVPNVLIKKLALIEDIILKELNILKKDPLVNFDNKDKVVNYLQEYLKSSDITEQNIYQLISLNKQYGKFNEISYYISKSLNLIDHKVVFLIKLYNFILEITQGNLNPYNLFYYNHFKKYNFLLKSLEISLPINKEEFDKFYQNVPEFIGSLINYYSPNKRYPRKIITNKNFYYDINFEVAAKCRQLDNKVFYLNGKIAKKMSLTLRDKIRAEFGLKKYKNIKQPQLPKIELGLKLINCN